MRIAGTFALLTNTYSLIPAVSQTERFLHMQLLVAPHILYLIHKDLRCTLDSVGVAVAIPIGTMPQPILICYSPSAFPSALAP